jgi:hypothetical protein
MGGVVVVIVMLVRLAIDSTRLVRRGSGQSDATTVDIYGACIEFLSPQARLSDLTHDHY